MGGRDGQTYLGADQARALIGRWQGTGRVSAPGGGGGYAGPGGFAGYGGQWQHPHHHHRHHHHQWGPRQYGGGYGGGYEPPAEVDYLERERRKYEWERMHPGIPFVGVEALMGADPTGGTLFSALEAAAIPPRAALVDQRQPNMANREVLPMSTGVAILPTFSAQITARPQRVAFRPERVFISGSGTSGGSADWIVNDIKIGNRSQFSQSGDVPGDMFGPQAIDSFVTFETAQTAMDVVLIVTYNGNNESGTAFYGAIVGTAAV